MIFLLPALLSLFRLFPVKAEGLAHDYRLLRETKFPHWLDCRSWAHSQAVGDTLKTLPGWIGGLHDSSAGTGQVKYCLRGIYKCLNSDLADMEIVGQEVARLVPGKGR